MIGGHGQNQFATTTTLLAQRSYELKLAIYLYRIKTNKSMIYILSNET